MTWRYLAARETFDGEYQWTIREFYSGIDLYSLEPEFPSGDTLDELRGNLEMMRADLKDGTWLDLDTGEVHRGES